MPDGTIEHYLFRRRPDAVLPNSNMNKSLTTLVVLGFYYAYCSFALHSETIPGMVNLFAF